MKAVVMAGGEGSRLRPLTLRCPKPLVPIANKPVMHHILDLLQRHGILDVVVTLHYLADQIVASFGDGADLGMRIRYTVEETPLGTAGSVKQAEEWLRDEPFLIISGDALTDANLTQLIESHQERGAHVTLALKEEANPLEYGVVVTDPEGQIKRFLEKPDWTEAFSNTINTGIYCLDPLVFDYMEPKQPYDWSHDIFPRLLNEGKAMFGHVLQGYWCDIGSLQAYRQSQVDALTGAVNLKIDADRSSSGIYVGEDARIDPGAEIEGPAMIGAGVHVLAGAHIGHGSVIGDNSIIEGGAKVEASTLWNGVYVGEAADLQGVILCRNSMVGRASRLEEGVIVGERSQILPESSLAADVKVWPSKVIESGTRLTMSLISGSKWSGSIFDEGAVRGVPNVEITPQYASMLGSAYASTLPPGSHVVVGRDTHPACRMIKRALLSGLMSSGVHVSDVHAAPEPLSRYLTRTTTARGGLHIHMSTHRPSLITVDFFDADGIALSKNTQRKVENLFGREDYRRAGLLEVGQIDPAPEAQELYYHALTRTYKSDALRKRKPRLLLDCAHGTVSTFGPALLGELGCRPIAINAYADPKVEPRAHVERMTLLEDLATMVPNVGAELGALLDEDATALHVVDDRGRVLSEPILFMAFAYLFFATEPGAIVAAPSAAPSSLEVIAQTMGGRVVRTRNSERALIVAAQEMRAAFGGDMLGRMVLPRFQPAYDGLVALIELVSRLSSTDMRLSQVVDALPRIYLIHIEVTCPWERKGEIIRRLGEEAVAGADLSEGVRVTYDDAWVLVLPDATAPLFHIYAQADSPVRLQRLLGEYQGRIEALGGVS